MRGLRRVCAVETMGLEPTTFWMQTRCSSQLSYVPEGHREDSGSPPFDDRQRAWAVRSIPFAPCNRPGT